MNYKDICCVCSHERKFHVLNAFDKTVCSWCYTNFVHHVPNNNLEYLEYKYETTQHS